MYIKMILIIVVCKYCHASSFLMVQTYILKSEQDFLAKLYQEHYSWLYFWLLKKLEGRAQAEDVVQDTFVKILRAGKVLQIEQPKPYLIKTATRVIIDLKRRRKIEQAYLDYFESFEQGGDENSPEKILVAIETLDRIAMMLNGLIERTRQIFLARYLDGYSQLQIAEMLGISRRTVQYDLMKALQHCDAILSE